MHTAGKLVLQKLGGSGSALDRGVSRILSAALPGLVSSWLPHQIMSLLGNIVSNMAGLHAFASPLREHESFSNLYIRLNQVLAAAQNGTSGRFSTGSGWTLETQAAHRKSARQCSVLCNIASRSLNTLAVALLGQKWTRPVDEVSMYCMGRVRS